MSPKPQPLQARDRLAFLLSLVPYLLDKGTVTVAEAAKHFSVDEDEIREAVNLIAVSGVPGETRQYLPGDLFDIAWDEFEEHDRISITHQVAIDDSPRFSAREAAALIAGLQYLSALPENAGRESIGSLMAKLTHGASAAPSQLAVAGGDADASLAVIRDAVEAGTQVEFDYLSARGRRERRRVDPLRIESEDRDWYLRGWCHLREAVRTFRFDRMSDLVRTDEPISHRAGEVALPDTLFQGSADDLKVIIDVTTSALPLLADYLPDGLSAHEHGERTRATLRVAHYHGLKRLIASLPGVVTVVDPPEARRAVAEWAEAGSSRYAG
jgi:proteasome accessory factor C